MQQVYTLYKTVHIHYTKLYTYTIHASLFTIQCTQHARFFRVHTLHPLVYPLQTALHKAQNLHFLCERSHETSHPVTSGPSARQTTVYGLQCTEYSVKVCNIKGQLSSIYTKYCAVYTLLCPVLLSLSSPGTLECPLSRQVSSNALDLHSIHKTASYAVQCNPKTQELLAQALTI